MANIVLQQSQIPFALIKRLVKALDYRCATALAYFQSTRSFTTTTFQELEARKVDRERVVILGSGWAGQQT